MRPSMRMNLKREIPLKETTKEEFEKTYTRLLETVKSNRSSKQFSKEIALCSSLYIKGGIELHAGYYTKFFVEQATLLCKKIENDSVKKAKKKCVYLEKAEQ